MILESLAPMRTLMAFAAGLVAGLALPYLAAPWFGSLRPETAEVVEEAGSRARDLAVATRVRTALALQRDFPLVGGIGVEVRDGVVTLTGEVETPEQRRLAELIVRGVEGVDEVVNRIEVAGGAAPGRPR